jgi:hypothetical protein
MVREFSLDPVDAPSLGTDDGLKVLHPGTVMGVECNADAQE